jgi:hypothetical protein
LVRWASQRAPTYRTLRQTLQICRRRMPHAVCVHARPRRWGPQYPGHRGHTGRRLFLVVWRMTQSRQAGVDCSGRAHVNFASNWASVGSGHRPLSKLGNTTIRGGHRPLPRNPSTRPLDHSTTQPLNHSTTQHIQATPHATLVCLPWMAAPTTTAATSTIATHCASPPSVPLPVTTVAAPAPVPDPDPAPIRTPAPCQS